MPDFLQWWWFLCGVAILKMIQMIQDTHTKCMKFSPPKNIAIYTEPYAAKLCIMCITCIRPHNPPLRHQSDVKVKKSSFVNTKRTLQTIQRHRQTHHVPFTVRYNTQYIVSIFVSRVKGATNMAEHRASLAIAFLGFRPSTSRPQVRC
jgi:hypothetical protein